MKTIFLITIFVLISCLVPRSVFATKFSLVAPTGTLSRGQNVDFTINIDTEGATVTTAQTDVTLDTQYIEYVSVAPGTLFPNVTGSSVTSDTVRVTGNVNQGAAGVTGTGIFAYLTVKITADSPGEAPLCQIATPTTPTPVPTTLPNGSPAPTTPPVNPSVVATIPPVSELPRSGTVENLFIFAFLGIIFTVFGVSLKKIK